MSPAAADPDDVARYAQRDAMDTALIRLYKTTGDRRRLERLVERFEPLARQVAARYTRSGEPFEDLMQVALLGLVKAIDRYEPRPGPGGFGAFARPTISGEIRRHFRDHTWAMKVPRSSKEAWSAALAARREHPDAPDAEIAEHLGLSREELHEVEQAKHAYSPHSIDARVGEAGASIADVVGAPDPGYQDADTRDEVEKALAMLGPRDREVVRLSFFDEKLQREIGDTIGVSQMQVSRILNRALANMRDHLEAPLSGADTDDDPSLRR
jgi:RNA polymerase sigma-B factor